MLSFGPKMVLPRSQNSFPTPVLKGLKHVINQNFFLKILKILYSFNLYLHNESSKFCFFIHDLNL